MKQQDPMRSLSRAIKMIRAFSPTDLELGATEMARKVDIPTSTTYRILKLLSASELLEHDLKTGKFSIGPELYIRGSLYLSTTDFLKTARPVIETLNDLTGEAVCIGIFDKGNIILIMKEESKYVFKLAFHIGSVLPAYASAIGKAILSDLTDAEIDKLYPKEMLQPQTTKTIATKSELKLNLEKIRNTGVAVTREENFDGVSAVACLIRNGSTDRKAVAGISITVPAHKMNQAREELLATLIRLGCGLVSYRLGYQDMENPVSNIQEIRSWWEQNQLD